MRRNLFSQMALHFYLMPLNHLHASEPDQKRLICLVEFHNNTRSICVITDKFLAPRKNNEVDVRL